MFCPKCVAKATSNIQHTITPFQNDAATNVWQSLVPTPIMKIRTVHRQQQPLKVANNQKICNLATRRRSGPLCIGFLRGIYAASDAPRSPVRALTEQQLLESRARTGHHHVHMVSKQQQQKKNAHFYEMVSLKVEIITIAQALATRCPPMFVPANEETHFSKISELFSTPFEEKKTSPVLYGSR